MFITVHPKYGSPYCAPMVIERHMHSRTSALACGVWHTLWSLLRLQGCSCHSARYCHWIPYRQLAFVFFLNLSSPIGDKQMGVSYTTTCCDRWWHPRCNQWFLLHHADFLIKPFWPGSIFESRREMLTGRRARIFYESKIFKVNCSDETFIQSKPLSS